MTYEQVPNRRYDPALQRYVSLDGDDDPHAGLIPSIRLPPTIRASITPAVRTSGIPAGTRVVWFLAVYPVIWATIWAVYFAINPIAAPFAVTGINLGIVGTLVLLALRDRSQLADEGLLAPHWAWLLLAPPLVYLVVRAIGLSRDGVDAKLPPIVFAGAAVAAGFIYSLSAAGASGS